MYTYILSSGATVNQSYAITADIIIFIITKNNLIHYISLLIFKKNIYILNSGATVNQSYVITADIIIFLLQKII